MNVRDIMNQDVKLVSPEATLREAAETMARQNIGYLPVGENDRLRGSVTDRDIILRAVSKGKDVATTTVGDVMTDKLLYCHDDQTLEDIARNMGEQQVRRLPVVDGDKRLVGVVSIGDLAQHLSEAALAQALRGITEKRRAA